MSSTTQDSPSPEFWRKRLAAWLHEWEISNKLGRFDESQEDSSGDLPDGPIDASKFVKPCNEPIQVGDLRILSKRIIGETDMPVYVAVISDLEDGDWLIAPYGQFSEPATPLELLTDRSDYGLRVLCLWNAQTISKEELFFSFLEDRLDEKEIEDAWAVFQAVSTVDDLPAHLQDRIGPPITHPKDPRNAYVEEFTELMVPIRKLCELTWWRFVKLIPAIPSQPERTGPVAEMIQFPVLDALAAAGTSSPNQKTFRVKGTSLQLIVQFVATPNEICFSLEDEEGPTDEMDGYRVVMKSGGEIEYKLAGGQVSVVIDSESLDFRLAGPAGKVVELIDEEQQ